MTTVLTSYEDKLRHIFENGCDHADRTGKGRRTIFGVEQRFDVSDGSVPVPTSRFTFYKGAVQELIWIIKGSFNLKDLRSLGATFWDRWGVTENDIEKFIGKYFSNEIAKHEHPDDYRRQLTEMIRQRFLDTVGPMYGAMWRNAPRSQPYNPLWPDVPENEIPSDKVEIWKDEYQQILAASNGQKIVSYERFLSMKYYDTCDQLGELIRNLKARPYSSRHVVSAWIPEYVPFEDLDPAENVLLGRGALSVCHAMFQCVVTPPKEEGGKKRLSLLMYQRSADWPVGVPFNMTQYAVLLHLLAHVTDMVPHEFIHNVGDAHIYGDQLVKVPEHLEREILPAPTIWINPELKDIFQVKPEDIEIQGYNHSGKLDYPVAR